MNETATPASQPNMTVYVVHHDHGGWSIRTTPVGKKWTEGPDKDCEVFEAVLSWKAARSIAQHVQSAATTDPAE